MRHSKFFTILEYIEKHYNISIITESGIAIKNGSRILRANVQPTLNLIQEKLFSPLNITQDMWSALGSTGKKESSGDLDIGLDINAAIKASNSSSVAELIGNFKKLCELLDWEYNDRSTSGFKMFHLSVPIVNQSGQFAQTDIMLSNNLDYTKFVYFSPTQEESKYKGMYRSVLLRILTKVCTMVPTDDATDDEKEPYINQNGRKFSYKRWQQVSIGPERIDLAVKTLKGKRGLLTNPIKDKIASKTLTDNPQELIKILFGDNSPFTLNDFNSFESIWQNIILNDKFPYQDKIESIINGFVKFFKHELDIKNKNLPIDQQEELIIPEEIVTYCSLHNIDLDSIINNSDAENEED